MSQPDPDSPYVDADGEYRPLRISDAAAASPAYAAARASWRAANAKDRDAWLANFAPDGSIEDPVGPSMFDPEGIGHHGPERRAEFWDKAVAMPDHIEFRLERALACGDELVCDGVLRTHMGENLMDADVVLHYRVDADGRVAAIRAYWELDAAMATLRPKDASSSSSSSWGPAPTDPDQED